MSCTCQQRSLCSPVLQPVTESIYRLSYAGFYPIELLLTFVVTFMQDIYILETNHVPRVCNIAVILWLQYVARVMLFLMINFVYFYINTFRSIYAVPNMTAYSSSLMCFPGKLLGDFLYDFEMVPVVPVFTGITVVSTFHIHLIFIVSSLYLKIISASLLMTFPSPGIPASVNRHVPFFLF